MRPRRSGEEGETGRCAAATPGEVVETRIAGQRIQTRRTEPAAGDWLVPLTAVTLAGAGTYLVRR